jgi:heme-degrading monooxygenase HmoA
MRIKRVRRQILLHGLVILLIGLLCGVPYGRAITQGWGDEAVRGWRIAHFSLVVGGMWLMLVAAVVPLLVLSSRGIRTLVYSVVTSGYAFTVALVVAAGGGVRGLQWGGSALNIVSFLGNMVASVASLVWVATSIVGTLRALRETDEEATMVLEVAVLNLRPGCAGAFEAAFKQAQGILASMPGYLSHELQRCVESKDKYLLLVRWQRLEDHTVGFRQSSQYQEWKRLLHHFYDPFPTVEHYEVATLVQ